jgi:biotin--protein ligase
VDPRYRASDDGDYTGVLVTLLENDEARIRFFRSCISRLGLTVNTDRNAMPTPSAMYLSSACPSDVSNLVRSWKDIIMGDVIVDQLDTFRVEKPPTAGHDNRGSLDVSKADEVANQGPGQRPTKRIVLYDQGYPSSEDASFFNHDLFYTSLKQSPDLGPTKKAWFGRYLLYGEVMESTNTLLVR